MKRPYGFFAEQGNDQKRQKDSRDTDDSGKQKQIMGGGQIAFAVQEDP